MVLQLHVFWPPTHGSWEAACGTLHHWCKQLNIIALTGCFSCLKNTRVSTFACKDVTDKNVLTELFDLCPSWWWIKIKASGTTLNHLRHCEFINVITVLLLGCGIWGIPLNIFIGGINERLMCLSVHRKREQPVFFCNWCGLFSVFFSFVSTITMHYLLSAWLLWLVSCS